ncbi:DUF3293 domain-containing protein [Thalassotalea mangrovi]|uniref:DUF3293 domain-containing protein n=1 Tax=Thalassotalea mangrovi TaxID=2572245 RepID=A0A4U1B6F3_9GAMM|nr:DUF3293 domain-containing protein [Thalassotalea mangrovi]TKB45732.1 DUF3293 domain-containing protein [Thalassotalea mangrovi]
MTMSGRISVEMMTIYRQARYRVIIDNQDYRIELGCSGGELHQWLQQQGAHTAALITACNPYSEKLSDEQNRIAQLKLEAELDRQGYHYYHGEGRNLAGTWIEPGVFILDIERHDACCLAARYQQNALVFLRSGPVCTLAEILSA